MNAQRRRFCFTCSPYKSHNTRDLNKPKAVRHNGAEAVDKWRKNLKQRIVNALGGKCQCCGYNKCHNALETHHLDPKDKEMTFSGLRGHPRAWLKIVKELEKCVLLCCLCHREIHADIRTVPENAQRFDRRWVDYKSMEGRVGFEPTHVALTKHCSETVGATDP